MASSDDFILQLFDGTPDADTIKRLGPIAGFFGEWESVADSGTGWNVIAVPGNDISLKPPVHLDFGFVLEVIPYHEELSFKPALVAQNRGPALIGAVNQFNAALVYEQAIYSDCTSDFCARRGFSNGSMIHRETGMLMNQTGADVGEYPIVRMGEIPHGNAIMCLGTSTTTNGMAPQIAPINTFPFLDNHQPPGLGYGETQYKKDIQFPGKFDQLNPNATLVQANQGKTFGKVIHVGLVTNSGQGGGILNTPFIQNKVTATVMSADYWLSEVIVDGKPVQQLQYSQTINLRFPSSDTLGKTMINWPHVTVNTLQRKN